MKRAIRALGSIGLLALTVGACGDDTGDRGNLATWCQLGGEINATLESGGQVPAATFDSFVTAAPGDVLDASRTAASAFEESPEAAFEDPDVQAAVADIEAFSEGSCQ